VLIHRLLVKTGSEIGGVGFNFWKICILLPVYEPAERTRALPKQHERLRKAETKQKLMKTNHLLATY
jgi:hypothetical protein